MATATTSRASARHSTISFAAKPPNRQRGTKREPHSHSRLRVAVHATHRPPDTRSECLLRDPPGRPGHGPRFYSIVRPQGGRSVRRSEERRVGKECRSRWSQEHVKNKD